MSIAVPGASWEDSEQIFASSVETAKGCYGHSQFEVSYHKPSRWLSETGHKTVHLSAVMEELTGNYQLDLEPFRPAISLDPRNSQAYTDLGLAALQLQKSL